MEKNNSGNIKFSKDEVIDKLKDDGHFDRLRLKIIRKLKEKVSLFSPKHTLLGFAFSIFIPISRF